MNGQGNCSFCVDEKTEYAILHSSDISLFGFYSLANGQIEFSVSNIMNKTFCGHIFSFLLE